MNLSQTQLSTRAREGSLGQPSPTLWPAAASPGLPPSKTVSRRSSSKSLFRQPSPDPWLSEFTQNRLSLPAAVHISAEQAAFSTLDRHEEEPEPAEHEKAEVIEPKIRGRDTEPAMGPMTEVNLQEKDATTHQSVDSKQDEKESAATDDTNSPTASRNSSLSDDSHHHERLPESPITSMDEDSKDHPSIPRRPSAKIQELVNMYDGLVKKKDDTLLVPNLTGGRRRSRSQSVSIRSVRTDDASDFGDFEDAQEFEFGRLSRQPSFTGSPRPTSSRAGRVRSLSRASLHGASVISNIPVHTPIIEEASNKFQDLHAKFGEIKFEPNLEDVDKLFDVAKLDKEQPSFKDYSLDAIDGIIKDSFTLVSERKSWYRISRPGTIRKHDMGDDDNYRRVTWLGSKVREDVTKTVRRWMEEESYPGRPAIGGGSTIKGGGGFNWDSKAKAEPLSFDQIFGKRKTVESPKPAASPFPRPLSLQPQSAAPGHSRNSSASVRSLPPRSPLSIPEPPSGPAFGWSTGANGSSTPTSERPSQSVRQSLEASSLRSGPSRATSIHEPESRNSLQLAPPPSALTLETSKVSRDPVMVINDNDEEEEEWGEMVASPAIETRPASIMFDSSFNGSLASLATQNAVSASIPDASPTLSVVSSKFGNGQNTVTENQTTPLTTSADIWDFSAFDSKPSAVTIPPTTISKTEFNFDTPLQSPTLSIPSRTGSPAPFQVPKSPIISRPGSPSSSQLPKPPSFRTQHSSNSSLSLVRPSPLHNVITSKAISLTPTSPVIQAPKITTNPEEEEKDEEEDRKENEAVRLIVQGLPDLSYMLR